jgi:hypothetical protein
MYPKKFFANSTIIPKKRSCFIAMPFAREFDIVFKTIREVVEGPHLLYTLTRTDELLGGGHIIEDILRGIGESEFVIADVTDRNPNVFYELGIAHMVKDVDKVILLSQNVDFIPFDLRPFRHIVYQTSDDGLGKLRASLEQAICSLVDKVHLIQVDNNCVGKLDYKIMGKDHYLYGFELNSGGFGYDSAKFMFRVTQYNARNESKIIFDDPFGLNIGEVRAIPNTEWTISLEKISENAAFFKITSQK